MTTWEEYISTYAMTPEQIEIFKKNNKQWSLEWESHSGGDMCYHVHLIYAITRGINAQTVVELGIRNGQSTRAMLYGLSKTGGKLWSNDIENCNHVCPPEFKKHWMFLHLSTDDFVSVIKKKNMEIDLLFIDADHSHEQSYKDFVNYEPFVRNNGFILMHDVYPAKESRKKWPGGAGGVWQTWNKIEEKYGHNFDMLKIPYCSGLGLLRKHSGHKETPNDFYFGCDIDPYRYGGTDDNRHGVWKKEEFELWKQSKLNFD